MADDPIENAERQMIEHEVAAFRKLSTTTLEILGGPRGIDDHPWTEAEIKAAVTQAHEENPEIVQTLLTFQAARQHSEEER